VYDLDVCLGHAASGEYHHHSNSPCLIEYLGDIGDGHSQIYGWILDGFPIYGPYQASGVLAEPCWFARDYSAASETGCPSGDRDCQLKDMWDYTQGTTSVAAGPSITGNVTTTSGNSVSAQSGAYFEDFYYDASCTAQGGAYLDSHNGHDHGDYGYHYHFTMNSEGSQIFPYGAGPTYFGCVPSSKCCSSIAAKFCSGTSICGGEVGVPVSSMECK
jgi:hypothetical protein